MGDIRTLNVAELKPPLKVIRVVDMEGLAALESYLNRVSEFGFDVETNVAERFTIRQLRTLQFGDRQEQYVVDLAKFADNAQHAREQQGHYGKYLTSLNDVAKVVKPHLENKDKVKIGHNLHFEYVTMRWNFGIRMHGVYDLFLAEKMLYAGTKRFKVDGFWALDDLVLRYLKIQMVKDLQKSFNFEDEDLTDDQYNYCALDVRLPCSIKPSQKGLLERNGLLRATVDCEFDPLSAFAEMYVTGMTIDKKEWMVHVTQDEARLRVVVDRLDDFFTVIYGSKNRPENFDQIMLEAEHAWRDCPSKTEEDKKKRKTLRIRFMAMRKEDNERQKRADKCVGNALINYSSPIQMISAFQKLGFNKADVCSTDDSVLEKIAENASLTVDKAFEKDPTIKSFGVIDAFRLYRSLTKSLQSYGERWVHDENTQFDKGKVGHIDSITGRIHPDINQIGASTGRTSASDPNTQNLPQPSFYRTPFVAPDENTVVITTDFNACELRILAELSQDPVWLNAFRNEWDLHSIIGELVYGEEEWRKLAEPGCKYYATKKRCSCKFHKELRDKRIKIINFSVAYGKTPHGLAEDMGITLEEAEHILNRWKKENKGVYIYLDKARNTATTTMQARTLSGRWRKWIRPLPDHAVSAIRTKKGQNYQPKEWEVRQKISSLYNSIGREGMNSSIQGTNADIAKRAMYYVWRDGYSMGIELCNMVHDELVCYAPKDRAEECAKFIGQCMEKAGAEFVKSIPMTSEYHIGNCWQK